MSAVQQLRPTASTPPPPRTPERETLRQAIERHSAAEQRLVKIRTAQERADAARSVAFGAARQAQAELDAARLAEGRFLVLTALDEAAAADNPVDAAVSALGRAEADLAAAKKLEAALANEAKAAENALNLANMGLNDAVRAALHTSPEVQTLLDDLAIARGAVADLIAKIKSLPVDAVPDHFWNMRDEPPPSAQADAAWQAAIAALRTDADTPLPTS